MKKKKRYSNYLVNARYVAGAQYQAKSGLSTGISKEFTARGFDLPKLECKWEKGLVINATNRETNGRGKKQSNAIDRLKDADGDGVRAALPVHV